MGFPGDLAGKESACNAGDLGSIFELGRSPGEGNGYLLQYSGLENSVDSIVLGVAKIRWLGCLGVSSNESIEVLISFLNLLKATFLYTMSTNSVSEVSGRKGMPSVLMIKSSLLIHIRERFLKF